MVKKGPTNSGKGLPPPLIRAMPERKHSFFNEVFPKERPQKKSALQTDKRHMANKFCRRVRTMGNLLSSRCSFGQFDPPTLIHPDKLCLTSGMPPQSLKKKLDAQSSNILYANNDTARFQSFSFQKVSQILSLFQNWMSFLLILLGFLIMSMYSS